MALKAGDWVEIKSKEEILLSLDRTGRLEGLPFMPQMFDYCGKRFKVFKRAHKACDTVSPVGPSSRRLANSVLLEIRCNGKAYGGCQAGCLIFWKESWLKPVNQNPRSNESLQTNEITQPGALIEQVSCSEEMVWQSTCVQNQNETTYKCQATEFLDYTTPLSWWDITQYSEDYASGNVTLAKMFRGFVYLSFFHLQKKRGNKLGRLIRWLYDQFQALIGGVPFPRREGRSIAPGQSTPFVNLDLQPGEFVRVKSYKEILATLDGLKNRGMFFDAELVPYCGGVYRVQTRVTRFINEKTGKMSTMKTPAVILEGVWCQSRYSNCRMFCPRSIYAWWREVWLERIYDKPTVNDPGAEIGNSL